MEIQCLGEDGAVLWARDVSVLPRETALFLVGTLNALCAQAGHYAPKDDVRPKDGDKFIGGYTLVED